MGLRVQAHRTRAGATTQVEEVLQGTGFPPLGHLLLKRRGGGAGSTSSPACKTRTSRVFAQTLCGGSFFLNDFNVEEFSLPIKGRKKPPDVEKRVWKPSWRSSKRGKRVWPRTSGEIFSLGDLGEGLFPPAYADGGQFWKWRRRAPVYAYTQIDPSDPGSLKWRRSTRLG